MIWLHFEWSNSITSLTLQVLRILIALDDYISWYDFFCVEDEKYNKNTNFLIYIFLKVTLP